MTPAHLRYLAGYPEHLVDQVRACLDDGSLGERLRRRYPAPHAVRNDGALYDYVGGLKARHLKNAAPLSKVIWDGKLASIHNALGTHTRVARVQGGRLKTKREIRIANLFRAAPQEFLKNGRIGWLPLNAFSNFPFLPEMHFMLALGCGAPGRAGLARLSTSTDGIL